MLTLLLPNFFARAQDNPAPDMAAVQEENKALRESIAKLKEQNAAMATKLAEAQAECKRLHNICKAGGLSTATQPTSDRNASDSTTITTSLDEMLGSIDNAVADYDRLVKNQRSSTGIDGEKNRSERKKAHDKLVNNVTSMFENKTLLVECAVEDITMDSEKSLATVTLKDFKFTKRGHIGIKPSPILTLHMTLEQAKEIKKGDRVVIKADMSFFPTYTLSFLQYKLYLPQSQPGESSLGELRYKSCSCTIKSKIFQPG